MKNYDFETEARDVISRRVRQYVTKKGKISHMATKAGIAPQTVSRVAYGETKSPRMKTIMGLLHALGYEVELKAPDDDD